MTTWEARRAAFKAARAAEHKVWAAERSVQRAEFDRAMAWWLAEIERVSNA